MSETEITAKNWTPPSSAKLRRLYDSVGCGRNDLAERLGVPRRTLFAWANPREASEITYAHYRLLVDIVKQNAERIGE